MRKKDKVIIVGLVLVLVILAFNMIETVAQLIDYEKRKESGNERWFQVENRILQTEEKVNRLEEDIRQWSK